MPRISISDMCDECNSIINELQGQVNSIRNNADLPHLMEREAHMMEYEVKRLKRVQSGLMEAIDRQYPTKSD